VSAVTESVKSIVPSKIRKGIRERYTNTSRSTSSQDEDLHISDLINIWFSVACILRCDPAIRIDWPSTDRVATSRAFASRRQPEFQATA
jgi:hypothetical protein